MRNASTFPRPVQSNRTTRDNSVIARGKAVFNSCSFRLVKYHARPPPIGGKAVHSNPPVPYRGQSGTSRKVAVHLSNFTPDAVRTSRYKGRAPRPVRWAPSLSPVLLTVPIIRAMRIAVNRFFKNIFWTVFFKDNENARARSGSQNRRKQAKTEVLNAEKFFEKSEKARKKRFFRRAARQHRAPIDRGTTDGVHQKRRSIENCMIQSYPQGKAVINRVFHKIDTVSIFRCKDRCQDTSKNRPDPKIDFSSIL